MYIYKRPFKLNLKYFKFTDKSNFPLELIRQKCNPLKFFNVIFTLIWMIPIKGMSRTHKNKTNEGIKNDRQRKNQQCAIY